MWNDRWIGTLVDLVVPEQGAPHRFAFGVGAGAGGTGTNRKRSGCGAACENATGAADTIGAAGGVGMARTAVCSLWMIKSSH